MDETRRTIIEVTVDTYIDDPDHLTPEAVCHRAGVDREAFGECYRDVNEVIRDWYPYALHLVGEQLAGLPDYETLPLQDRLGTFCFMLLDVLESRLPFVQATFRHQAAGFGTPFHDRLQESLGQVLKAPNLPGVNTLLVDTGAARFVLAESVVQMIGAWLRDDSDDRARATALIDRILALLSEILTNRVPEKAIDLFRYAVEAGYLPLDRLPLVGELFRAQETDA